MTDQEADDQNEGTILDGGPIDVDSRAGRSLGIDPRAEPDDATKQRLEEERQRRLDPGNRPDGAEVDNTDRTFDAERGAFTDSEDYEETEPRFSDPEDPNNPDNKA